MDKEAVARPRIRPAPLDPCRRRHWRSTASKRRVIDSIRSLPDGKNFYLVKWFMDPHWPYLPEERFRPPKPESLPLKTKFYAQLRNFIGKKLPPDQMQFTRDLYAGEVASVDDRVGRILDALRERELLEKTFVIFTSDHGDEFRDHRGWGHGSSYFQELVHIPMIIMGPGIEKGRVIEQRLSHLDLMPTLSELLGLEYQGNFQGESYAPLLLDPIRQKDRLIYLSGEHKMRLDVSDAVVLGDHKLILSRDSKGTTLYDLESDPDETVDTADELPKLTKHLNRQLHAVCQENRAKKQQVEEVRRSSNDRLGDEEDETLRALKAIGYVE